MTRTETTTTMRRGLVLAMVGAFIGACPQRREPQYVTAGWWGGEDHYFDSTPGHDEWDGHEIDVVRDQAARHFRCSPATIDVRDHGGTYVAVGCDHRAPFVLVSLGSLGDGPWHVPGRDGVAWPTWIRAVNVLVPAQPPPAPSGAISRVDR